MEKRRDDMSEITVRKRGKYWEYSFEGAKIEGKRKRISKSGFRTKADASAAGIKAKAEFNEAGFHFVPSEISFNDFLDYWMETYCKANLKQVTITNYEKKLRLHIKPELGIYKLKALTTPVLQKFMNQKAQQNYSRITLSVIKGILSGSLNYAVKQNMIRYSPMVNVTLPSPRNEQFNPRTAPHVYIPPDRIQQIFTRFPEGTSTHIPMMLGYRGGLRIGEAFAGMWEDVNFEENTYTISRQVQWNEQAKAWYFSAPKYDSRRTIELDADTMELLKREKERQERARAYYGKHYTRLYVNDKHQLNTTGDGKGVYLIAIRENGAFIIPRSMQHTSRVVHKELNYPEFDFHSLRHTHATMLAENGVPPKYLQERLGHKDLQVTMKYYLHLTDKMNDEGLKILRQLYQRTEKNESD